MVPLGFVPMCASATSVLACCCSGGHDGAKETWEANKFRPSWKPSSRILDHLIHMDVVHPFWASRCKACRVSSVKREFMEVCMKLCSCCFFPLFLGLGPVGVLRVLGMLEEGRNGGGDGWGLDMAVNDTKALVESQG